MIPSFLPRLPCAAGAVLACLLVTAPDSGAQNAQLLTIAGGAARAGAVRGRYERSVLPAGAAARLRGGPARLARRGSYLPGTGIPAPVLPDTLRVLLLRIEFVPDTDPTTTGDGTFDLRSLTDFTDSAGHQIDAAPHDRGFAERHLRALHHYWWAMSNGKLSLETAVYPSADTAAYRLPCEMSWYGFTSPLGDILTAYETLVADAVAAADAGEDPIDWAAWDAVVLMHAGADWQGDIAGDTPADLPTAWVVLGTPVMAGTHAVGDVTVIPETVSQDGFVGAINGIFAHEFGHQLGLPDLYDTVSMSTAVGLWALMDTGGDAGGVLGDLYVWGVLPTSLSPWTRMWLGWREPAVIGAGESSVLAASTALDGEHSFPAAPRLLLVPAGDEQAFLVELRADDLDGSPEIALNWEEGVIDGTARLEGDTKVLTYEYDALLPGAGVIIWHLDTGVAASDPDGNGWSAFADNTLQGDRLHRFLDIEEADGRQELGWVPGYLGDAADAWQPDPVGPALFGPFTTPSSTTWTGAFTGLEIAVEDHLSPLAVTVRVSERGSLASWSAPLPGGASEVSVPWLVDADGDGEPVVAVLDSAGGLHLFTPDGTPRGVNPVWNAPTVPAASLTLAGEYFAVAAGQQIHFISEEGLEIAAVDLGRKVSGRPTGSRGSGAGSALVPLDGGYLVEVDPDGIAAEWSPGPVRAVVELGAVRGRLVAAGSQLWGIPPDGSLTWLWTATAPITSLVAYPVAPVVGVVSADGVFTLLECELASRPEDVVTVQTLTPGEVTGPLSLLPLPGALQPAFLLPTVNGLYAFDEAGHRLTDWPPRPVGRAAVTPPRPIGSALTLSNSVLCTLTEAAELIFYDLHARTLFGGARALSAAPAAPPTLAEGTDGHPLFLMTGPDSLKVTSLAFPGLEGQVVVWAGREGSAAGWGTPSDLVAMTSLPPESWRFDFYPWPNPARHECRLRLEGFVDTWQISFHAFTSVGTYVGEIGTMTASGPIDEFIWDVSRLAPGIYRVVAEIRSMLSPEAPARRRSTKVMVVR